MTILKSILFGLAAIPLTVSMAFAVGNDNSAKGADTLKRSAVSQSNIERQIPAQERRVIRKKALKPFASSNDNEDNIAKLTHFTDTSDSHDPNKSIYFIEMKEVQQSIVNLSEVRPPIVRPSVSYDWANAPVEMEKR